MRAHELEVAARTSVSSATPTVSGTSSSPSVKNWQRLAQNATRSSSPLHSTNSERSSSSPLTDSRNRASSRTGMIAGSIKVDVVVGDKVFFDGTKSATVRYIGEVHFAAGVWYGLQLLDGGGKHDGTLNGKTYFRCKAMFVKDSLRLMHTGILWCTITLRYLSLLFCCFLIFIGTGCLCVESVSRQETQVPAAMHHETKTQSSLLASGLLCFTC